MRHAALFLSTTLAFELFGSLPSQFDLRSQGAITSVKKQSGGTCWTHATMAAIESNLTMTGVWANSGESGEAALAEYHLDWWNGFNRYKNLDTAPYAKGLTVHQGGDYRVAAAYLARGAGAVREVDAQSFSSAPSEKLSSYHYYYVRDIEWLASRDDIKQALVESGAVGTALHWSGMYYSSSSNSFYQPSSSGADPNHAVTIVGWDDNKVTQSPNRGAWLIKNSWGSSWGDKGYFWISYDDKVAGHHSEMGAVSFRNVEPSRYSQIYSHDYHGWRATRDDVSEAFNHFTAKGAPAGKAEWLKAVSFYTADSGVVYSIRVHRKFADGQLQELVSAKDGVFDNSGYHTVDLNFPVVLNKGDDFYILVKLSIGGLAYDKTSDVPVLLGANTRTMVPSSANPGESYFRSGTQWHDLTDSDDSANFCIKALSIHY